MRQPILLTSDEKDCGQQRHVVLRWCIGDKGFLYIAQALLCERHAPRLTGLGQSIGKERGQIK